MKKQINFDENVLLCPICNGNYLHQSTVGIYNCDEDAVTGLHLEIDSKSFTMDTLMKDNPSPRRHGLSILFYCEYCDGEDVPSHILNIYQHKGQTIMEWEGV